MDVVVNLRSEQGRPSYAGESFKILGKPIYEVFFNHLSNFHIENLYLIVSDVNDDLYQVIHQKFKEKFRIEPLISTKLTDASLLKRVVSSKKLEQHFIYFSQLLFTDIDLQDFYDFHKYNDSNFTVALAKQPRSFTPFGYFYLNHKQKIEAFNYKYLPDNRDLMAYINFGIYGISKKAITEIKNNNNGIKLLDDLFKYIVFKNKRHYTYISDKNFNNLSTLEEYYNIHMDLLTGKTQNIMFNIDTEKQIYIPNTIRIGSNFQYSNPILVCDDTVIGNNVTIKNSIIAGKSQIGNNVVIENAFIGEDVHIDDNVVIKNQFLFNQFIPSNSYIDGDEKH